MKWFSGKTEKQGRLESEDHSGDRFPTEWKATFSCPPDQLPIDQEPTNHELFDLTGKAALITGGTGWLGTSFSWTLAEAETAVVIGSRA